MKLVLDIDLPSGVEAHIQSNAVKDVLVLEVGVADEEAIASLISELSRAEMDLGAWRDKKPGRGGERKRKPGRGGPRKKRTTTKRSIPVRRKRTVKKT